MNAILIFTVFFVYTIFDVLADDLKCHSCASLNLYNNWDITDFSKPPNTMTFTYECDNHATSDEVGECITTKGCITSIISADDKQFVVRGCIEELSKGAPGVAVTATDNNNCYPTQLELKGSTNLNSYVQLCLSTPDNPCNTLPANTVGTECKQPQPKIVECVECSWYDGDGKCKHNSGGSCKGPWCTKTTGTYLGKKFETRGCSLNPFKYDKKPLKYNVTFTTPGNIKDEYYDATTWYCDEDKCNNSPVIFSVSIIIGYLLIHFLIF